MMCCSGEALAALSINEVNPEEFTFDGLVKILEQELDSKECAESYFLMLTRREQRVGESLQELGKDIRKLVKLAYPNASKEERERTAKEYFKKAIADSDIKKDVFRGRPSTLDAAISIALESESFYKMDMEKKRARNYNIRSMQSTQAQDELDTGPANTTPGMLCYYCGESGHRKKECPVKQKAQKAMRCYTCNRFGHTSRFCRQREQIPPQEQSPSVPYNGPWRPFDAPQQQFPDQPPQNPYEPQGNFNGGQQPQAPYMPQGNFNGPTQGAMGRRQNERRPNQGK